MYAHKFLFVAVAVFSVLCGTYALQEQAKCEYNAVVSKKCGGNNSPTHPDCCFASPGTCGVTYKVSGSWLSEVEAPPSQTTCRQLCNKHFRACRSKCKCLTSRKAIRSGRLCKCIPNDLALIFKGCDLACKASRKTCLKGCKLGGPCAKASTSVNFFRSFPGRCGRVTCGRPTFIGIRPKWCPVCTADGKCSLQS